MIRRFLPLMLLAVLAAPVAHAQTSNIQCPYTYLCVNPNPATNDPNGYDVLLGGTSTGDGNNTSIGINSSVGTASTMPGGTAIGYGANIGAGSTGFAGGTLSQISGGMNGVSLGIQSAVNYNSSINGAMPNLNPQYAGSVAVGPYANTGGAASLGLGAGANAGGNYDVTIGAGASSSGGNNGTLIGGGNVVIGYRAAAPYVAANNVVLGYQASVGNATQNSVALGANTVVNDSNAVGVGNRTIEQLADGVYANDAVAIDQLNKAMSYLGGGAGFSNGTWTAPTYSLSGNVFNNVGSALTYLDNRITGLPSGGGSAPVWLASTDTTTPASALGTNGTAVGAGSAAGNATTSYNTAVGINAAAGTQGSAVAGTGGQDTAVGYGASAPGIGSEAFGYQASAPAAFATAIGNYSLADQANTVSFGNDTTGVTRRLVNISPGIDTSDAMTMGQGQTVTSIFGAGANLMTSTAPTYIFTSPYAAGTYYDVGSALTALDNGQNAIWGAINNLPTGGGSPGPVGPQGPAGSNATVTAGNNIEVTQNAAGQDVVSTNPNLSLTSVTTTDGKGNTTVTSGNGVSITSASGDNVSITTAGLDNGNNVITGVANGQVSSGSTQAVNGGQLFQAQVAANAYTDQQVGAVKNWAQAYTDAKVAGLSDQINRTGAASAAMSNVEYRDFRNSFGVGLGWQGGHNGVAVGFRHVSDDGSYEWHVKAAISGAVRSIGVGMSWGWN
ncbi:MAG: hypothetical protein RSP_05040 [Rhodanobacter sp.]